MTTNRINNIARRAGQAVIKTASVLILVSLASCNDWLKDETPGSSKLEDFFTSGDACVQVINGCYTPLAWDYGNTYFAEWFIGDIASDDALKGGQNLADGADAYDIDNFKTNANNGIVLDYYRAKFQGIIRCNLAIEQVGKYELDATLDASTRDRLLGEAYFLRGLYYFQLVRVFGGVPLIDEVLDNSDRWKQERATADAVYEHIVNDFRKAESLLWPKARYADEDYGRATKGAAQAFLCKAELYRGNNSAAYEWGLKFVDEQYRTGKYSLNSDYALNFMLAGENGPESVFEIQYIEDPTSDYGGFGFTRGTFNSILTRPREALGNESGWGWDHPTNNLYAEYEPGDPRREMTIGVPPANLLDHPEVNYLGSPYYNIKTSYAEGGYATGVFPRLAHHSRGPLNYPLMRTSDALLLFAEAALESGRDIAGAKWALEEVRKRARAQASDANALPAFPNYRGYADNTSDLRDAIRHERRVELAMEGHRWFDLVRWGIAAQVMDRDNGSYGKNESADARKEMAKFVAGKNELFPIPAEEIALNPMPQNPGY